MAPSEKKEEEVKTPTKKEQISNMLFNDFLKGAMKIFNYVDNDFLTITPYMDKDAEENQENMVNTMTHIPSNPSAGEIAAAKRPEGPDPRADWAKIVNPD